MLSLAQRRSEYAIARDTAGMTVEEYERACGLPPFSIVPAARSAKGPGGDGWFMYWDREAAVSEEERQMACLRALGMSIETIASLYGCHHTRIYRRIDGKPSHDPEGIAARRAERAEENRQMACLRRLGLRLSEIGALFGCTGVNIYVRTKMLMGERKRRTRGMMGRKVAA